jgi:hypothetical protein
MPLWLFLVISSRITFGYACGLFDMGNSLSIDNRIAREVVSTTSDLSLDMIVKMR